MISRMDAVDPFLEETSLFAHKFGEVRKDAPPQSFDAQLCTLSSMSSYNQYYEEYLESLKQFMNELSNVEHETQQEISKFEQTCDSAKDTILEIRTQLNDLNGHLKDLEKKIHFCSHDTQKQEAFMKEIELERNILQRLRHQLYCYLQVFKIDWSPSCTADHVSGCLRSTSQKNIVHISFDTSTNDLTEQLWDLLDVHTPKLPRYL